MVEKKICAFLTHQNDAKNKKICDLAPENLAIRKILKHQIQFLIDCQFTHFLTGLELGADTWCAEILITLKRELPHISLECRLPFEHQADHWSLHQRENYFSLIAQSDQVNYVSLHETKNCRYLRDKQMIQQSNIALLLGITDLLTLKQSPLVAYAKKAKTPLIYIDHQGSIYPPLSLPPTKYH